MPPEKFVQLWQKSLEPELIERFTTGKRSYFEKLGKITNGAEVQNLCNSTFGGSEFVVSEYGVAYVIYTHSVPFYVLGVSVKDYPNYEPLTLYELTRRDNNDYIYRTRNMGYYDFRKGEWDWEKWYELLAAIDVKFEGAGTLYEEVTKNGRTVQKDSCAPKATLLVLMLSATIHTAIRLFF